MPGLPPIGDVLGQVLRRRAVSTPDDSLLLICARPRMPDALLPEVTRRAALVTDWDSLLTLAEEHGVGPLLAAHLSFCVELAQRLRVGRLRYPWIEGGIDAVAELLETEITD